MAYARNLPKRFSRKSERCSGELAGSALQAGSTTTSSNVATAMAAASRLGTASPRGEESGRSALQEDHDRDQDGHLGEHGAERGLDPLVQPADARRGQDGPRELPDAARHHHHEGVHDVVLAERWPHVADLGEGGAREAGEAGDETSTLAAPNHRRSPCWMMSEAPHVSSSVSSGRP